ncbi:MAG: hypothetical protein EOM52_03495 [Clostridia bacterium]|nr:hypothetical protein [Clostridia bacterium]
MKKYWKLIAAAGTALALGGLLLGAAQGTQTDPLVTLSYINNVTTPAILKQVDTKLDAREKALTDKLDAAITKFTQDMEKLAGSSGGQTGSSGSSAAFSVVTVPAGKQLVGGVGSEFLLRGGAATCVAASAPGLIDSTGGTTLAAGGALQMNHLYMSTADGRGLKATSQATVLVRGSYTIQ